MCGIAGVLTFDGRPVSESEISQLTNALAHRGRDSSGTVIGGSGAVSMSRYPGVAFGHRRLSVIDLSSESAQPMVSVSGTMWITYNGELYNFEELKVELRGRGCVFRTHSDTEVVLEAYRVWGEHCLSRFNGMFAFSIWDDLTQSLFCARDPIGIKPFYYTLNGESFRFASEAQALIRSGAGELDRDSVSAYLLSMYVPGSLSMFSSVRKLLPGRLIRVRRDGTASISRYWDVPQGESVSESPEDTVTRISGLLDKAVASQLRSDVPIGALLSGGFDSGMVVASASQATTALHTYSVGFDDGLQLNELPVARSLAERYGTRHHERVVRSEEVLRILDSAIASMSEPAADSAVVPTYCLSQMAADDGVKVLLTGTGGDEVFGGYTRYVGHNASRRLLLALPDTVRRFAGAVLLGQVALGARLRHRALDMMMNTGGSARLATSLFPTKAELRSYLEHLATEVLDTASPDCDQLYQHMQFDLKVYLPDLLLMLLDQLTMAHTVEGRVPLLDVELVTASLRLPPTSHATAAQTKLLMRRMAVERLDLRTFHAPKQGFSGPVRQWIEGNRAAFRERTMAVRGVPFCERIPVEQLWSDDRASQNARWPTEVFLLYVMATWYYGHAWS